MESDFTVVNWDQRGSGRTYGKNGAATPGMSTPEAALECLCQDTREVAEYTRKRLSKKKIILIGQSWGPSSACTSSNDGQICATHSWGPASR